MSIYQWLSCNIRYKIHLLVMFFLLVVLFSIHDILALQAYWQGWNIVNKGKIHKNYVSNDWYGYSGIFMALVLLIIVSDFLANNADYAILHLTADCPLLQLHTLTPLYCFDSLVESEVRWIEPCLNLALSKMKLWHLMKCL